MMHGQKNIKRRILFIRPIKTEQSVPKRRHIKFRRRGITQKKEHNKNCFIAHAERFNPSSSFSNSVQLQAKLAVVTSTPGRFC
jgi:hypothetical protein